MAVESSAREMLLALEKLDASLVRVYQNRCTRVRNRRSACHACADVCTSGAIGLDEEGRIAIDGRLCIGCGTCATACPTCALEALHPDDRQLALRGAEAMRANGGELVVACTDLLDACFGGYDERKVVEVACAGRIDESFLATMARMGCARVVVACGHCGRCAHASGRRLAEDVVDGALQILEVWGNPIEAEFLEGLPASVRTDAGPVERPEEEARSGDAPVDCGDVVARMPKVGADGTLEHHWPNRRGRLLKVLQGFGDPADVVLSTRLWGSVWIEGDQCRSCRLCAVLCPTGALEKVEDPKTHAMGLRHTPAMCVQCGCCEDACPGKVLTLRREVAASDVVDGRSEYFELEPLPFEMGKPTTVVNRMRGLLVGANHVNFA